MKKHLLIIFFILLATLGVVSGCFKKPSQNTNTNQNANTNIGVSNNGEDIEVITSDIDTSDWLTYRNEEYGFEVRYPRDWEVNESKKQKIYISYPGWREGIPEGGGSVTIHVQNISLQNFISQYNEKQSYIGVDGQKHYIVEDALREVGEIKLNGIDARYLEAMTAIGLPLHFIFANKNDMSYIIEYHDYDQIHKEIISTFKFR